LLLEVVKNLKSSIGSIGSRGSRGLGSPYVSMFIYLNEVS
jgi:hypothetical protein